MSVAPVMAETIKVGILHSLSGTVAISETTLEDVMAMLKDDLNNNGGLLGKQVEPVAVDPASGWPLFAEKACEPIGKEKVAVVFGCWTSVSHPPAPAGSGRADRRHSALDYQADRRCDFTTRRPGDIAILLVEQFFDFARDLADRFVVMDRGEVVIQGCPGELDEDELQRRLSV